MSFIIEKDVVEVAVVVTDPGGDSAAFQCFRDLPEQFGTGTDIVCLWNTPSMCYKYTF